MNLFFQSFNLIFVLFNVLIFGYVQTSQPLNFTLQLNNLLLQNSNLILQRLYLSSLWFSLIQPLNQLVNIPSQLIIFRGNQCEFTADFIQSIFSLVVPCYPIGSFLGILWINFVNISSFRTYHLSQPLNLIQQILDFQLKVVLWSSQLLVVSLGSSKFYS